MKSAGNLDIETPEGGRDYASSFCFAVCSILSAPSMAPSIIGKVFFRAKLQLGLTRCRCSLSSRMISGLKYRSTGSPQTLINWIITGSQDTTQEIEIYFNFLGRYIPPSLQPVPLTPEEQEELRKKKNARTGFIRII